MNIVVLDGYALNPGDLSWEMLSQQGSSFVVYDRTPPHLLIERSREADVLIINKVIIRSEELLQLPRLKYIGITATGYDNVDIQAAQEHHITVCNVPNYSTQAVAQLVFAHLLAVTNHVEKYADQNKNERWTNSPDFCYWDAPLIELHGKTIGIIGLGHIGMTVANIAQSFGMKVLACTSKAQEQLPPFICKEAFTSLLAQSDVLTLHCPLTPQTQQLIAADELKQMKPSAILINTARGGLINENDIAQALVERRLYAYCSDVLTQEPPGENHILLHTPYAYITQHIAWATVEARQRLLQITAENLYKYLNNKPQNTVS